MKHTAREARRRSRRAALHRTIVIAVVCFCMPLLALAWAWDAEWPFLPEPTRWALRIVVVPVVALLLVFHVFRIPLLLQLLRLLFPRWGDEESRPDPGEGEVGPRSGGTQ